MRDFPKVLIIGQPFNDNTGGGITLTNLFSGWNRDKIAVACSGWLLSANQSSELCNTYYQLGHKELKWVFPFNILANKYSSGIVKFNKGKNHDQSISKSKIRDKIIMDYFYPFLRFIGLYHLISKAELSEDFRNWVNEFNPDIVYAQARLRNDVLFCTYVQNFLKKPFVYHVMDDWPALIENKGIFKNYWHKKIDSEFRTLLEKATRLLSISDAMSKEYKKRYNKDFIVFHNPIDIEFWKKYQRVDYKLAGLPTILYAGRTGLGVDKSLETIAKSVQSINEKSNVSLIFKIQTREHLSWTANYPCVEINRFVHYNDLPRKFSEADLLILPYDFSDESIKYLQFSMPTKAPEYMISGTPIIVFAPEVTAIAKYAREYKWAKLVTVDSVNELSKAITQILENIEDRQNFGRIAKRIAEERHNSIRVRNDFRDQISLL